MYPNNSDDCHRNCGAEYFADIHMCLWKGEHCEQWAQQVCRKRGVEIIDLRGFRAKDGISLQYLPRQDFSTIVGEQYCAMFWKELMSYRAMQKQRCPRCISKENSPVMTSLPNNVIQQEMASDLSYSSRSRQNSPSPYQLKQEYSPSSYRDQLSPIPYEVRSRYPEEHSPIRYYEDSGYHEPIMSPDGRGSHPHLSPSPESYRSLSQSPQSMYPEHVHQRISPEELDHRSRPQKPLPELIRMDVEDEVDEEESPSHETHLVSSYRGNVNGYHPHQSKPPPPLQLLYPAHHPIYVSQNVRPSVLVRPSHHNDVPIQGGRIIHYVSQPHPRSVQQTHVMSHPSPKDHAGHPQPYPINHHLRQEEAYDSAENDDEGNDEPGPLVIDLRDESQRIEKVNGLLRPQLSEADSFPHLQKIPTKRKRDRGPKSWEFLMRLLADPETNPSIIRWEDEAEGSFRLVQPQEIANMWGTRSNKEDLSYNNFARALRYHYKTKLLYKISERQLVYGCGPTAINFYRKVVAENAASSLYGNNG